MICGQVPTELEIIRRRIAVARSIAGSFDAASEPAGYELGEKPYTFSFGALGRNRRTRHCPVDALPIQAPAKRSGIGIP